MCTPSTHAGIRIGFLLSLVSLSLISHRVSAAIYENPYPDADYQYRQINNILNYRLFVPPSYDPVNHPDVKHPLVIYLHGNGEREGTFVEGDPTQGNSLQMANAGQYAFVAPANQAIFPCFLVQVQRTNDFSDARRNATAAIPAALAEEYNIDLDRVIITGLSGGGGDTLRVANNFPSLFAAVVPICTVSGPVSNLANVATWFFHATNDGTVGVNSSRSAVNNLRNAGATPIYTEYASGNHWIWEHAYATPALIPWMAAQRRGLPPQNNPAVVRRFVPNQSGSFESGTTSVTLIGTVEQNGSGATDPSVSVVRYYTGDLNGTNDLQSTTGPVTGWTANNVSVGAGTTRIKVVALGTSWSGLGGATQYSQTLTVTRSLTSDNTNPTASIHFPTVSGSYTTPVTSVLLSGSASDNQGVTSLIWKNNRGGLGPISGTSPWWSSSIPLKTGANVITVEARDRNGNVGTASITVECTEGPPPPIQWAHTDVGTVDVPGQVYMDGDLFTIEGSGLGGMWGNNNNCHFAYVTASGDCSITARIHTHATAFWESKSGLLIMSSLAPGSAYVVNCIENSRGAGMITHNQNEGWGGTQWDNITTSPAWLRLTRTGNSFSAYTSPTGEDGTWTQIGTSQTVNLATDVLVGLFVTSVKSATSGTAQFSNVTVDGAPLPKTGYAAWAEAQGLTGADLAPSGDADGDGISNLVEYGWGTDPTQSSTDFAPQAAVANILGEDYLAFQFERKPDAHDVIYTVQVLDDLGGEWQDIGVSDRNGESGPGFVGSEDLGDVRRLTFRDVVPASDAERRFMRLQVSMP
jgi:poly(3-hydroxybutyrate) depolymerase